ncbi:MAG: hypothetical protein JWQ98_2216 [Chlorobi bacterium]|nr:hypothetical protein [Chlorobiota bacterium]
MPFATRVQTIPVSQRAYWGTRGLEIDYQGEYTLCDSIIDFTFTAMLGHVASGAVRVQQFKWTGIHGDFVQVVRTNTAAGTFELQDICREGENGHPRLIIPDGIGTMGVKITLKPNPVDRTLLIDFQLPVACAPHVAIFDVFGNVVRSIRTDDGKQGMNSLTCDVVDLPIGSYFGVLTASGTSTVARFDIAR